ncbi:NUDIX domain-containing protein [Candidatus Woesearchaeota archaeon]|nr:NUDIX domain-containing protein [Candidatus Woesearchaeota archaeon]
MAKTKTGRAIVLFPYHSSTRNRYYNSVVLSLERNNGKYSLPGGSVDPRKGDKNSLDAAVRELKEEFGLLTRKENAQLAYTFSGNVCEHDVYLVYAHGNLEADIHELRGIGFYNAGRHNAIPNEKLERHVKVLQADFRKRNRRIITPGPGFNTVLRELRRIPDERESKIQIPDWYFIPDVGGKPEIKPWTSQRKSFS